MRRRQDRGAVAVLVAILSLVLLSIGALAVDLSNAFVRKRDVQRQADFAALAGGADLGNQTSGTVPSLVVDAVRDQLNGPSGINLPQDDGGKTSVTSAELVDGDVTNGEVRFANGGLQVVAPRVRVNYGLAGVLGFSSVDVAQDATVGVFSPGTGVMPVYAVAGCDYGTQTITDPATGHATNPPIPTLAFDGETNATTLTDLSPAEVPKDAAGVELTLSGTNFNNATKVGFFRADNTDPSAVVQVSSFTAPSPFPAGGYTKNNGSMRFVVPTTVTSVETAWYVRVFEAGSVNNWSKRSEAQPLRVGQAVLECSSSSTDGNFGTLKLPRNNPGADSSWIPVNIADGLESPLSLAIHNTPASDGRCTGGLNGAVVSVKPNLVAGTNCVDTDTGLPANPATAGLITGSNGYTGRLVASSSSSSERGPCAPNNTTDARSVTVGPTSYSLNNDVLTCFLMDGTTSLAEISSPSYSGGPVLSTDIYASPRFFWQPVLKTDPSNGGSGYYSIVDFRPGFLTDEVVASSTVRGTNTATSENGIKVENNSVKQLKVVFFNADALSADDSGVVVTPYLGVGPRILRLID